MTTDPTEALAFHARLRALRHALDDCLAREAKADVALRAARTATRAARADVERAIRDEFANLPLFDGAAAAPPPPPARKPRGRKPAREATP